MISIVYALANSAKLLALETSYKNIILCSMSALIREVSEVERIEYA